MSFVLYDDGSTVQVYHVAGEQSKGIRIDRRQSSSLERETGDLPLTRCGGQVKWTGGWLRTNRCSQGGDKYPSQKLGLC
jgi:hypothetical protein